MGEREDLMKEFWEKGDDKGSEVVDLDPFIRQIERLEKRIKVLSKTIKTHNKTVKSQKTVTQSLKAENKKLEDSLAKQINLNRELADKEMNRLDVEKILIKTAKEKLHSDALSENKARDLAKTRKMEIAQSNAIAENKARDIAISKKQRAETIKNAKKIRLLNDRVKSYGLSLKKIEGASALARKALKGDRVAYQQLTRSIDKARMAQGKFDKSGALSVRNQRNLGGSLSVLRSKLLIASFAIGGSTRFMSKFIDASRDQEISVKRVTSAIASQGYTSGVTTKQAKELASSLQKTTGVTDELTLESSALLLSFKNIGSDIFPQAQKAVLDMTSALNGGKISTETLKTQSIQLAKALDNPIKGLSSLARTGTTFDESTKKQIKTLAEQGEILEAQTLLIEELNKQYGDTASIDSYERSQRAFHSAIGDINEEIGFIFLPAMKKSIDSITEFASALNSADIARGLASMSSGVIIFGLMSINIKKIAESILIFKKSIQELGIFIAFTTGKVGLIVKGLTAIIGVLGINKILEYLNVFESLNAEFVDSETHLSNLKEKFSTLHDAMLDVKKLELENNILATTNAIAGLNQTLITPRIPDTFWGRILAMFAKDGVESSEVMKNLKLKLGEFKVALEAVKEVQKGKTLTKDIIGTADDLNKMDALVAKLQLQADVQDALVSSTSEREKVAIDLGVSRLQLEEQGVNVTDDQRKSLDALVISIASQRENERLLNEELKNKSDLNNEIAKSEEVKQEAIRLSFQLASESAQALHTIFINQMGDISALEEAELKKIKNTSEYRLAVAKGDQDAIERLEKGARAKSFDARMSKYKADQALAYSNIVMNLAQAIMNVVATYKDPITIAGMITAYTSLAGIQASAVYSAPAPEKFAMGGLIGGRRHSAGGTMIEAERGEFIMNRQAVKNFGANNLNAMNSGSAPLNITFNNSVMSEDYTEDIIIPQIKRALQRGADIGIS